jgi:hypothetical protein
MKSSHGLRDVSQGTNETMQEWGGGEIKENDGEGEFNYDIL